jgi:hypothetical protein
MSTQKPTIIIKSPSRFRQEQERRDRLNEQNSIQYLIDEVYHSMMGVKAQFCMMYGLTREIRAQDSKNLDRGSESMKRKQDPKCVGCPI